MLSLNDRSPCSYSGGVLVEWNEEHKAFFATSLLINVHNHRGDSDWVVRC